MVIMENIMERAATHTHQVTVVQGALHNNYLMKSLIPAGEPTYQGTTKAINPLEYDPKVINPLEYDPWVINPLD